MNGAPQKSCTWCHGKGYIRKSHDFSKTNKLRWLLVLGFVIFMAIISRGEVLSGLWAWIFIGVLVAVFAFQFGLDIFEGIRFFFGKKVICPHCGGGTPKESV